MSVGFVIFLDGALPRTPAQKKSSSSGEGEDWVRLR